MPDVTIIPGLPLALASAFADGTLGDTIRNTLDAYGVESLVSSCALFAVSVTRGAPEYIEAPSAPDHVPTWFAMAAARELPDRKTGALYRGLYIQFGETVVENTHALDHAEVGAPINLSGSFSIGEPAQYPQFVAAATEYIHRLLTIEARYRGLETSQVLDNYRTAIALQAAGA